jgi:glycosyltransferase involved in cell wall biosynthesis
MLALEAYFRVGMASVTRFTVQTEDMKQQLTARWDLPSERIDVIPSSVLPLPPYEPLKSSRPFIACVTSAGPHKNLSVLPELLASLSDDVDLRLTVASHEVPELVARCRRLRVFDRVVFEGAVTRAHAMSLLASAECAVLPSLLESFGFGFYEAMAVGTPVVAADRGFAREACGEAAHYADPSSGEDFARAVNATLESSRDRQAEASRARFAHVARTWDQIADSYVDSIRRAVQR